MDMRNKPWLLGAALIVLMMVLVFLAGLMLGRGAKAPTTPPAAPAAKVSTTNVHAESSVIGRTASKQLDGLRRGVPVDQEAAPLPMARVENVDRKRLRAYPMQPPTIPHPTSLAAVAFVMRMIMGTRPCTPSAGARPNVSP